MAEEINKNIMDEMSNNKSEGKSTMSEIDEKLKKEKENLKKFKERRASLDEKIKESESNIERLTLLRDNQKYNSFATSVKKKGLTFDDIVSALQTGDFLSLQEKFESNAEELESQKHEV